MSDPADQGRPDTLRLAAEGPVVGRRAGPARPPVFLERTSYRQRRLRDTAVVLPALGVILWVLPLMSGVGSTARVGLYVFGVWVLLIVCAALIHRAMVLDPGSDPAAAAPPRSDAAVPPGSG